MSTTILTLFGEEVTPEPKKAKPKAESAQEKPKKVARKKKVEEEPVASAKEVSTSSILDGWEGDKQYYTIGEVAKLFKVRTSNIRFWTNEFEMKVRTTRKGDRLYTPDQVREIRTIYHLVKEKKFTIKGAKAQLSGNKKAKIDSVDLIESLKDLKRKLLQIKKKL